MEERSALADAAAADERAASRAEGDAPAVNGARPRLRELARRERLLELARSDTGRAAGLAGALMVNNFIALIFTVAAAHLLGASDYGSLIALLGAFAIVMVPGSAIQATVAREVSAAAAAGDPHPGDGVRRWLRHIVVGTAILTALAILLRDVTATVVAVDESWAAAAVIPSGCLWLILSVQRGALQGLRRYRMVGVSIVVEAVGRLAFGVALVLAGLDATGAFLGTPLGILVVSLAVAIPLHRAIAEVDERSAPHLHDEKPFRHLMRIAAIPVAAFVLIAALQNVDVIFVKHLASDEAAGSYAAASVAAKAVIWVAIGLGLYLLPEAVRRAHAGRDARPILGRTLGLIALVAIPMVAVYAIAAERILAAVFGDDLTGADGALPLLALAMSLLACGYLAVQYLLALGRRRFLAVLAAAAAVEVALLPAIGADLTGIALGLVAIQGVLAGAFVWMIMRGPVRPAGVAPEALA